MKALRERPQWIVPLRVHHTQAGGVVVHEDVVGEKGVDQRHAVAHCPAHALSGRLPSLGDRQPKTSGVHQPTEGGHLAVTSAAAEVEAILDAQTVAHDPPKVPQGVKVLLGEGVKAKLDYKSNKNVFLKAAISTHSSHLFRENRQQAHEGELGADHGVLAQPEMIIFSSLRA